MDIVSADPAKAPAIDPNSLVTEKDRNDVIAGVRLCQRIMNTKAMGELTKCAMDPNLLTMDDEAILEDFRKRCGTGFHPVGSCRMGKNTSDSVVDTKLRVHGVGGLRVIDASVFPYVTSGNTNAPTIMVACRTADMILEVA
ncbi:MAG: GMC oxidoreductase [Hyphomicrobiales bacterium]